MREKLLLGKYAASKLSVARFIGSWDKNSSYRASVRPHGFNDFASNNLCTFLNGSTGCTGRQLLSDCKLKFLAWPKDPLDAQTEKIHLANAFHLLRGEAISWLYGLTFLDALNKVESALNQGNVSIEALYQGPKKNYHLKTQSHTERPVSFSSICTYRLGYSEQLKLLLPKLPSPSKCQSYR